MISSIAPNESSEQDPDALVPLDALRGLDSSVIGGFLALETSVRDRLIDEYANRYGDAAGHWLAHAADRWPERQLGVSRVVTARLFALLPSYLNQEQRLELAKSIWHVARAPTGAVLRVPAGYRNHGVLSALVRDHFLEVLPSATELPQPLLDQEAWLSDPAMQAQHDVLNLLLLAERDQLLELVDEQIEVLFARRMEGLEIRSRLEIAGHQLVLRTDGAVDEPVLRLRDQGVAQLRHSFDGRAPRSALIGAVIGASFAAILFLAMSLF